jgi:hypothetical protein
MLRATKTSSLLAGPTCRRPGLVRVAAVLLLWLAALFGCSSPTPSPAGADTGGILFPPGGSPDGLVGADATVEEEDDSGEATPDAGEEPPCTSEGGWGCPCKSNGDCTSSHCIDSEKGPVCTRSCTTDCPKDWVCKTVQTDGADLSSICVPMFTNLCKPCKSHDDCTSIGTPPDTHWCVPSQAGDGFLNGSFCGTACDTDADCRDGYGCKDITLPGPPPATKKQCVPTAGECGCMPTWVSLQSTTECSKTNKFGTCKATRTCTAEGLTLCAADAPAAETCDGADNDCDGQTDEAGAKGCVQYFADADKDGVGVGQGTCSCGNPGPGYAIVGGDCNDLVGSIYPGAPELCNNIDDNCNGETDEAGAKGCKFFYKDKDKDGFGDDNDAGCLCPSKATKEWISTKGDCDDANKAIYPGVTEVCDGKDNNCNAQTDEANAEGCAPAYVDADKDGYGAAEGVKCLCAVDAVNSTDKAGDCNDNNPGISPKASETCDNVDEDCNGQVDDGTASQKCPVLPGGTAAVCKAGVCGIASCPKGKFDVDGKYDNGCECQADDNYGVTGGLCKAANEAGEISDGGGASILLSGNLMPGEDGDWYHFLGKDSPDDGSCDQYNVRVKFVQNPGSQFVFDMFRGGCAASFQTCTGDTESSWSTSFYGQPPSGPQAKPQPQQYGSKDCNKHPDGSTGSPKPADPKACAYLSPAPEKAGECKCTAPGKPQMPGMNVCSDNTAHYYVRVFRKPGVPASCQAYTIQIDNSPQ